MAMDMARLDNTHCVLQALSDSSCPEVSSSGDFVHDHSTAAAAAAVVPASTTGGEHSEDTTGGEFLNFVTDSDVVLDFDCKLPDEVSGVEGDELSFDDDSTKSLQNLELRELKELLQDEEEDGGNNSVNNNNNNNSNTHNEVGEEEALLLAKARDDSGECSSGGCARANPKCKIAAATTTTTTGGGTATTTKKKAKVDWTPELHRRFVHAVEQLGVEKAFPSRILELMGVQCLTRHNIASHLQKYRSHRRHLAAREAEAASWTHRRTYQNTGQAPWPRTTTRAPYLVPLPQHIQPRPLQPAPLKVWGYPTVDHSNVHMWQQQPVHPPSFWQAADGSYWQHPAAAPPVSYDAFYASHPMRSVPVVAPGFPDYYGDEQLYLCNELYDSDIGRAAGVAACSKPTETPLSKEVLDAAIGEALANPWTPPPLGLKPPSMEGVIAELQRQGINTVPPSTC